MKLLQYELFYSISQTLNISKTAEQFYISQPAVSGHLKNLENELGVELVKRTKHGVYLTEAGLGFVPYVQQILGLNNKATTLMKSFSEGTKGNIRIAVLSSASYMVSSCLRDFYEHYPDIHVDISLVGGVEMPDLIRHGDHEFYFAVSRMTCDPDIYDSVPLEEMPLALFANKALFGDVEEIDWEFVAKQPFVTVPSSDTTLYGKAMHVCETHGFVPHIVNTYNRAESVVLSIDAGLGVGILPISFQEIYARPNVVCFPIKDPEAVSKYVCLWKKNQLSTSAKYFIDLVLEKYSKR